MTTSWHIITGEYPPQAGGVSDYTRAVAQALASAGDRVTIWAPPCGEAGVEGAGITVRRLPDRFGRAAFKELDAALDREAAPRRILVQYVPHAFGWKALNVPFCWWLRSRRRDSVWVMFHEVAFDVDRRQPLVQNAMAVVTRRMAGIIADAAQRAFVSIPSWEPVLRTLGASAPIEWLPVPSTIPVIDDSRSIAAVRGRLAEQGRPIVGHFGTYGGLTRPLLEATLPVLLGAHECHVVLLGRGSQAVAHSFGSRYAEWRQRVVGTGVLPPRELSLHLSACDLLLQPYPDGISSRRTSAMAGLAHARAVATTEGWLTEPIWRESGAVTLASAGEPQSLAADAAALAGDKLRAARMGQQGRALYEARFDIRHTIAALRDGEGGAVLLGAAS